MRGDRESQARGIKSFGMVLAASNEEHTTVEPLMPPPGSKPGTRLGLEGMEGPAPAPASANVVEKKKHWETAQHHLLTGEDKEVRWRGKKLVDGTVGAAVSSTSLVGARVA